MQIVTTKHNRLKVLDIGINEGVKYNDSLTIDINSIPTTIPMAIYNKWFTNDDKTPAVQEINYPIKANGYNYDEPFFKSFLDQNLKRPFPGSAGHYREGRGETALLMIGGLLISNGDGTGKVFFKNKFLNTPLGQQLQKEFDSHMLHFSLVSMTRDQLQKNDNGEYEWHVVASEGAERNDAIDNGQGAMKQKTNENEEDNIELEYNIDSQKIIKASVSHARSLINSGDYNNSSSWSFSASDGDKLLGDNDWTNYKKWHFVEDTSQNEETKGRYKYPYGKNGKVYTSALRAIASRAGQQGWDELSNTASSLIDLIDKKESTVSGDDITDNGGDNMTKEDIIKAVGQLKANTITLPEIVEALGCKDQLLTDKHINALSIIEKLNRIECVDPVKEITELREKVKKNFVEVRSARLNDLFGLKIIKENGTENDNPKRLYADKILLNVPEDKFNEAVENFKIDPITLGFAREEADETSKINTVTIKDLNGKTKNQPSGSVDGIRIEEVK